MTDRKQEAAVVAVMLREVAADIDAAIATTGDDDVVGWETWDALVGLMIDLKKKGYSIDSLVEAAEEEMEE
jgi:hypothetical protein